MGRHGTMNVRKMAAGTAIGLALVAGTAHAEDWETWAPAPLVSDSSYAALQARPPDSLSAGQVQWLAVQRDWRMQRDMEAKWSGDTQLSREWHHRARRTDERFAALASKPYGALTGSERAWLVEESAAQRSDQLTPRGGVNPLGLVLLGFVGAIVALAAALNNGS